MTDASKTSTEHRYKEAFCLMWYGCKCGHRERIWNSRDGVTPFTLRCPSCGDLLLQHCDWILDEPRQDHQPHKGQRVWRNGTSDEAADIMTRRIARMRSSGYEIDDREAKQLVQEARSGGGDFRPGWPMLVTVTGPDLFERRLRSCGPTAA